MPTWYTSPNYLQFKQNMVKSTQVQKRDETVTSVELKKICLFQGRNIFPGVNIC